ncbi:hypothetical protein A1O1_04688 [Capronia coronata CBS 617.96]|uniref:Zn(2)-C6 fungal-type domain-containing protein n=1 Tax=Capronia coronata CBS 617.96 TaxID=1182541 RepID=W9YER8_9EURO|nr:uncharacterized protein A1O1_04688 [Capronia coronata CBS 617.96]EXJ87761.1 hypothetical protein A1O1_04688 [Capronia coronata CBS 617.96]
MSDQEEHPKPVRRVVCSRCAQIKQACDGGRPCSRCRRLDVICEPNLNRSRGTPEVSRPSAPIRITRAHTGCATCKKRKRKCDEARPRCSDCRRLCLDCHYPSSSARAHRTSVSPQVAPSRVSSSVEPTVELPGIDQADFAIGLKGSDEMSPSSSLGEPSGTGLAAPSPSQIATYASDVESIPSPGSNLSNLSLAMLSTAPMVDADEDRSLLNHYMRVVAGVLSRRDDRRSNPYLSKVLPMALADQLVMDAVLALSASHWKKTQPAVWKRGTIHQTNALQSLAKLLPHIENDSADTALAATLLLAMIELFDGTSSYWKVHLDGARRLLSAFERKSEWTQRTEYRTFYRQLYHYLDSATTISTCHPPLLQASSEDERSASPGYSMDDEECLYGIPKSLFHFVDQLNGLAYQRKFRKDPVFESMFRTSAASLHKDLDQWAEDHKLREPLNGSHDASQEMAACHVTAAFEQALQLRLHQIVNGYSLRHKKVKQCVSNILDAVQELRYGSPWENSLIFPLVMAGSSCDTDHERLIIDDRFLVMERTLGFRYIYTAHDLVRRVWKERQIYQGTDRDVNWAAIRYFQIPGLALV